MTLQSCVCGWCLTSHHYSQLGLRQYELIRTKMTIQFISSYSKWGLQALNQPNHKISCRQNCQEVKQIPKYLCFTCKSGQQKVQKKEIKDIKVILRGWGHIIGERNDCIISLKYSWSLFNHSIFWQVVVHPTGINYGSEKDQTKECQCHKLYWMSIWCDPNHVPVEFGGIREAVLWSLFLD